MKVCIQKSTGKILEAQSHATPGTMIKNLEPYFDKTDLEEKEITDADYLQQMKLQNPEPNLKAEFSILTTDAQRINYIAKRLNLK